MDAKCFMTLGQCVSYTTLSFIKFAPVFRGGLRPNKFDDFWQEMTVDRKWSKNKEIIKLCFHLKPKLQIKIIKVIVFFKRVLY
jgi:hypothetical protein